MGIIHKITQKTENPFLNLYDMDVENRMGERFHYYLASRAKTPSAMKLSARDERPDGVEIYSIYGENRDRVVLIRQYRFPLDDFVYEFPAGLVEPGEDFRAAAIREMKEETGLTLTPIPVDAAFERPYFTSVGMTDECCATVYGYAAGEVSRAGLENNEEIEVVLADRDEVRRILKEERVSIMCAYMLMHFLRDEKAPFDFLRESL